MQVLRGPFQGQQFVGRRYDEGAWVLASVLRFVAFLLVIAAVVYVVRAFLLARSQAPRHTPPFRSPGLDELDMRYARGEVSRSEYLERRADMTNTTPPPPPAS
jgi:uncharacterized membrane protein